MKNLNKTGKNRLRNLFKNPFFYLAVLAVFTTRSSYFTSVEKIKAATSKCTLAFDLKTSLPSPTPTENPPPTPSEPPPPASTATPTPSPGETPTPPPKLIITNAPTSNPTPIVTTPGKEITPGLLFPTFIIFTTGIILLGSGIIFNSSRFKKFKK